MLKKYFHNEVNHLNILATQNWGSQKFRECGSIHCAAKQQIHEMNDSHHVTQN